MPLMPATRPLSAMSVTAATPIRAPPIVEAIGVNSVMVMEPSVPIAAYEPREAKPIRYRQLTDVCCWHICDMARPAS